MRRWFFRWLKTQWTAVPLAFLIVTAIEVWRTDDKANDGRNCRETGDLDDRPHLADIVNLPSVLPPSTTKQPPKISQKPKQESQKNVVPEAAGGAINMTGRNRPWSKYGQAEIVVNTSRPVVNPHPFKYIINCPDLCRDADVFLLNYVHTAVGHFGRRARIRRTWALQSHYRNFTIRTVFFVGISPKTAWYQEALLYESRKYGDIVQKDFIDTYKNLSYKGVAALQWITENCDQANYIMKTDDDVFVNMFALLKHLNDIYHHGYRLRVISCYVFWRMHVLREGQWGIPMEMLPDNLYPPYCSGMGYVFSTDVAVAMYRVSFYVKFFWVDDAFISGFLPRALGGAVNHSDMGRAYCGAHEMGLYWHDTEWYKYIFTHVHDENLYQRTWNNLLDIVSRRIIPTPRFVRPGNLAEQYLPKHVLFPLKRPSEKTKEKKPKNEKPAAKGR